MAQLEHVKRIPARSHRSGAWRSRLRALAARVPSLIVVMVLFTAGCASTTGERVLGESPAPVPASAQPPMAGSPAGRPGDDAAMRVSPGVALDAPASARPNEASATPDVPSGVLPSPTVESSVLPESAEKVSEDDEGSKTPARKEARTADTHLGRIAAALLRDDPDSSDEPTRPDIRDPGPELVDFPNGSNTVPQGRGYINAVPVGLYGPSRNSPATYRGAWMLQYGLTDRAELRLFSDGVTSERGPGGTTGFAPLAFDLKIHLWDENRQYLVPSVAIEGIVQSTFGSPALSSGVLPTVALLFDHTLPLGINLEWNVSLTEVGSSGGKSLPQFDFVWAFEKNLTPTFGVFVHGYYHGTTEPEIEQGSAIGAGGVVNLTNRFCVFGSYNGGLNSAAPTTIFLFGCAFAL